ncbi:MAG TPA: hypothetical protein VGR73_00870 [Bryobacteraceae bacterium]|nr:hypothetical protein [Bryobacteraceae bacterium]
MVLRNVGRAFKSPAGGLAGADQAFDPVCKCELARNSRFERISARPDSRIEILPYTYS